MVTSRISQGACRPNEAGSRLWLILRIILSALSGTLLFLSDHPVHLFWLQSIAFIPWLWALAHGSPSKTKPWPWIEAALLGLMVGLFYAVPLLIITDFPWKLALGLGAYITVIWMILSVVLLPISRWPGVKGPFAAGAMAVLAEWVSCHAIPIWGTAQSFVRVWSASPFAIQFIEVTGFLGIVFVLMTSQALAVGLLLRPSQRLSHGLTLLASIVLLVSYNAIRWSEKPDEPLRVAAVGWTINDLSKGKSTPDADIVHEMLLPLLTNGIDKGARLIVAPEAAFEVDEKSKIALFSPIFSLARHHRVSFAIGYFDRLSQDNRVILIDETGSVQGEYLKTHLVPIIEAYNAGDGSRKLMSVRGHRVGTMVCQDDNFTDLASGYGRDRAVIVAVPTNDWAEVKDYHYENSRLRPVENRYGIVRAATDGISGIVSARGEVLAELDHFERGPGIVIAELPLFRPGSPNAWMRHGFALLCALLLGGLWVYGRINRLFKPQSKRKYEEA